MNSFFINILGGNTDKLALFTDKPTGSHTKWDMGCKFKEEVSTTFEGQSNIA